MRRIVFYLETGTNERQYLEMISKIQLQYRERIFPVLRTHLGVGQESLDYADWDWVSRTRGKSDFTFWVAAPWGTTSPEDTVLDAMFIQHLELSIVPLVYWDDVPMESSSHDCSYDMGECQTCTRQEWDFETATTAIANDLLADTITRN